VRDRVAARRSCRTSGSATCSRRSLRPRHWPRLSGPRSRGRWRERAIVLDDVQWLDRPTSAALTFALRRIGTTPLRVLVAERSEGPGAAPPFGLDEWDEVGTIVVGALPATALGVLIRQRLGVQLSRPRLEEVERTSGGNPLFALELVRAAATDSPGTLVQTLGRRIYALDAATRETVSAAAAALRPTADFLPGPASRAPGSKEVSSRRSSRSTESV
jgi:hypothetical protein